MGMGAGRAGRGHVVQVAGRKVMRAWGAGAERLGWGPGWAGGLNRWGLGSSRD